MVVINTLLRRPVYRYLTIGGSVYLLELSLILVSQAAGLGPVAAVALSFVIGTVVSFGFQKVLTFGDKRLHHKVLIPQLMATCLLVLFNFIFTVLLTKLLADIVPAVVSRTLALLLTTIWNFYLYKTHIFKQSTQTPLT